MPKSTKFLFLLGGSDLEMVEIKALLEKVQVKFLDAGLNWNNSRWDAYMKAPYIEEIQQSIASGVKVYGIELRGDIPSGCELIDHHNELQYLPASLVQVGELLDLKLDPYQQLVAANDKGYIPAMKELGATKEEIDKIRSADRKAQGVSEKEEKQAEMDIKKGIKVEDLLVVETTLSKFSPIADKLYGKTEKLLIYNEDSLNYYGIGKGNLVEQFKQLIKCKKAYQGGGELGYFGISNDAFKKDEIIKIKDTIISLIHNLA